jgi:diguanylate cyclase (GGDEF)-like protein
MRRRPSARAAVVVLVASLLGAGAVALLAGPLHAIGAPDDTLTLPWWALAPLFTLTELTVASVQLRRESLSISFAEVPLVLGLVFCTPRDLVLASILGSAVGLVYHRQLPHKLFFNSALFAQEAALGAFVYHAVLGDAGVTDLRGFLAAVTTIVVTQLVSGVAVTIVVLVTAGRYEPGVLREAMTSNLVAGVANTCVGLLVVVLVTTRPGALSLLAVVVTALTLVYRGYSRLSRGHARLESLYRYTDRLGSAVRTDAVVEAVLGEAREVMTAEAAELVLLPDGEGAVTHLRLSDDGVTRVPAADGPGWWQEATDGRLVLRRRGEAPGIRDGLAVPLRVDESVIGALIVTDRPHHLDTFGDADLKLFASLANHASLTLHKARLVDRLAAEAAAQEHRSLHDPLTGLPNRRHLLHRLDDQLAAGEDVTLVMLDLDGFKDINEALGHETGDLVLTEFGHRLIAQLGAAAVARLGNDEFAAVLAGCRDLVEARARTESLCAALARPFEVAGVTVDVRSTAGLARAPEHASGAAPLLQHADSALYAAKQHQRGVEVYDPRTDVAGTRLLMTDHLRTALAAGDLEVYFQPKVAPATGTPMGAEALVRWTHPEHGSVGPDVFVPLAEHTGLIRPLTDLVIGRALRACADWRSAGYRFGVAVNLSARCLADAELPGRVRQALLDAGLSPAALTLEITETAVMSDVNRGLAVLRDLRDLGIHLSVDDFGIGQSSLAYLKRLPVQEVKIDKAFVLGMADDRGDAAIVRAAIELGHALGLTVVAEGVEDCTTQTLLAEWDCDVVQGFHISRPVPQEAFLAWLGSRTAEAATIAGAAR